jgi:Ca2+-binding EF-hand superfamily protein
MSRQVAPIAVRLKIAGFFLTLAEWDRSLEVTRQIMNGIDAFEPYAAFLRIAQSSRTLTVEAVENFLRDNCQRPSAKELDVVLRLYDTKFSNSLDFEDFLKMTLARDNPQSRFEAAATRETYAVGDDQRLPEEIEYTLSRFFTKACELVTRVKAEIDGNQGINEKEIFSQLSLGHNGNLDFKVLKQFFEELKIVPKDSEIISILRAIDINDDGIIDRTELEYFISMFSNKGPSSVCFSRLRDRSAVENQVNYFGERRTENSGTKQPRLSQMASQSGRGDTGSQRIEAKRKPFSD